MIGVRVHTELAGSHASVVEFSDASRLAAVRLDPHVELLPAAFQYSRSRG